MIKYFTFAITIGYADYPKEYIIEYTDGICYAEIITSKGHQFTKEIREEEFNDKITPFEKIGIYKWRKNYYVEAKDYKDDDISWILQYQEVDKRCRSISGYGKFPDGWKDLLKAVNNVFPKFPYKKYIKNK